MVKWLIVIVLAVLGNMGYQKWERYRTLQSVDTNMARIAGEMNEKMPMSNGVLRVEKVEYAKRTLRYTGTLLKAEDMNEAWKNETHTRLKDMYCGDKTFRNLEVGVAYEISKAGPRSLGEKVRPETWTTTVEPKSCT